MISRYPHPRHSSRKETPAPPGGAGGQRAARARGPRSGARAAAYLHGLDIAARRPLYRAPWMPAIRWLDVVVANSRATAGIARSHGGVAGRICLVHPGVELPPDNPEARARFRCCHELVERPLLTVRRAAHPTVGAPRARARGATPGAPEIPKRRYGSLDFYKAPSWTRPTSRRTCMSFRYTTCRTPLRASAWWPSRPRPTACRRWPTPQAAHPTPSPTASRAAACGRATPTPSPGPCWTPSPRPSAGRHAGVRCPPLMRPLRHLPRRGTLPLTACAGPSADDSRVRRASFTTLSTTECFVSVSRL